MLVLSNITRLQEQQKQLQGQLQAGQVGGQDHWDKYSVPVTSEVGEPITAAVKDAENQRDAGL